jgi:hypothetical protein
LKAFEIKYSATRGGFGGMRDGFDLTFPPDKIANISTGWIELVSNSVLRVGWAICGLLLLENEGQEKLERNMFKIRID